MATSGGFLQVLSGSSSCTNHFYPETSFDMKTLIPSCKQAMNHEKVKGLTYGQWLNPSRMQKIWPRNHLCYQAMNSSSTVATNAKRLKPMSCKRQRAQRVTGTTRDDLDEAFLNGDSNIPDCSSSNGQVLATNMAENEKLHRMKANSVEDEAWNLLQESVVNYCGNPVGTIAANDPNSPMLNYDQVFIRDFVPSGIAFLLKGEYEIVRNFILHTLQLQSWEKTMDCYSPGQGLMPVSFKVQTVPLDGDDNATEDVLDPDFGEAAIGRVAPVDLGLWWIILLRAYGKCSGDLSVQERVDVQLE